MLKMLKIFCALNMLFLAACRSNKPQIVPAIVPQSQKTLIEPKRELNVIGAVEPIYILPIKAPFYARVDTGATTSSLDVYDLNRFERDGKKWVSFKVKNERSGEEYAFEKRILKRVAVKRIDLKEHRLKVAMDVKFGGKKFATEFTLAEREDFDYQALIGRSILTGRYVVDTSLERTLK